MRLITFYFFCINLLVCGTHQVNAKDRGGRQFFKPHFPEKSGCFVMLEMGSNAIGENTYGNLCDKPLPPMSTFKIALAAMAFDSGFFKTTKDIVLWDGKPHHRKSENKDQTPKSFIANSVIWVSRRIIDNIGARKVGQYLQKFNLGNKLLKGDPHSFWLSAGSLKVTPMEQAAFLKDLWTGGLKISADARLKSLASIFYQDKGKYKVYGKTGTGCIDPGCMGRASRQLGWFVGIVDAGDEQYAFALVIKDSLPKKTYGGPRARRLVMEYLEQFFRDFVFPK